MTKEELEKEAEEYLHNNYCCKNSYCEFNTECKERVRIRCTEFEILEKHIVNFAESREKRIAELEAIVRNTKAVDESFAKLQLKNTELKAQIEKMKCCGNCAKRGHICVAEEMQGNLCGKNKDKWELRR